MIFPFDQCFCYFQFVFLCSLFAFQSISEGKLEQMCLDLRVRPHVRYYIGNGIACSKVRDIQNDRKAH